MKAADLERDSGVDYVVCDALFLSVLPAEHFHLPPPSGVEVNEEVSHLAEKRKSKMFFGR